MIRLSTIIFVCLLSACASQPGDTAQWRLTECRLLLVDSYQIQSKLKLFEQQQQLKPDNWLLSLKVDRYQRRLNGLKEPLTSCHDWAKLRADKKLSSQIYPVLRSLTTGWAGESPYDADLRPMESGPETSTSAGNNVPLAESPTDSLAEDRQKYQQAVSQQQWLTAQQILKALQQREPDAPELLVWQRELSSYIKAKVEINSRQGRHLYGSGRIAEALALWNEALKLDPDNEQLISDVQRAERFLENLRALEKQPEVP